LCAAVEKRVEATARKAAESLYEGLLYDTQDYLRENVNYNLKAELDRLGRENQMLRETLNRIGVGAGVGPHNYDGEKADAIIAVIERLRENASAAPTMAEALENLLAHTEGVTLPAAAHVMREKARAALSLAKGEDRNV
ncbi:MAG: hypothetical protein ACK5QX_11090, partial [bacterium]